MLESKNCKEHKKKWIGNLSGTLGPNGPGKLPHWDNFLGTRSISERARICRRDRSSHSEDMAAEKKGVPLFWGHPSLASPNEEPVGGDGTPFGVCFIA